MLVWKGHQTKENHHAQLYSAGLSRNQVFLLFCETRPNMTSARLGARQKVPKTAAGDLWQLKCRNHHRPLASNLE
jgi:hypothetical protein